MKAPHGSQERPGAVLCSYRSSCCLLMPLLPLLLLLAAAAAAAAAASVAAAYIMEQWNSLPRINI